MPMIVDVRAETAADHDAVHQVLESAFGQPEEARLVRRLRTAVDHMLSLVAVVEERVVGHILFTPVEIVGRERTWTALGLGPMAVHPDYQRQGVGTKLLLRGLEICAQEGHEAVFVLGHPTYYPRFGFVPTASKGIRYKQPVPAEVFMVKELRPGCLAGRAGVVAYHEAFDEV